jgi:hypothetical protein
MAARVFVSYSSKDGETARRLLEHLESCGIPCWMAPRDIQAGTIYAEAIVEAIDGACALLLLYENAAGGAARV